MIILFCISRLPTLYKRQVASYKQKKNIYADFSPWKHFVIKQATRFLGKFSGGERRGELRLTGVLISP
jgi:hypothetical protein